MHQFECILSHPTATAGFKERYMPSFQPISYFFTFSYLFDLKIYNLGLIAIPKY